MTLLALVIRRDILSRLQKRFRPIDAVPISKYAVAHESKVPYLPIWKV